MVLNLGLVLEKFSGSSTVPEYSRFELNLASTDGNVLRYLVPVLPHVLTDHCVLRVQDGCTISVLPLKTREKN